MTNQTALVAQVKADCVARGIIPDPQTSNLDAFAITARVAWMLRGAGAKLIRKGPAQNHAEYRGELYGIDAIAFPDGWVDCLSSAGPPANVNAPTWQWHGGELIPTAFWLDPPNLDATAPAEPPPPVVTPPVTPPDEVTLSRVLLEVMALRADVARLNDLLALDSGELIDGIGAVRAEITDLRVQWAHGLTGSVLGYVLVLKPL